MVTASPKPVLAATLPRSPFAVDEARPLVVPGLVRRAALVLGNLLAAVSIVLCIPFFILAIGAPLALFVRFLLWITGRL